MQYANIPLKASHNEGRSSKSARTTATPKLASSGQNRWKSTPKHIWKTKPNTSSLRTIRFSRQSTYSEPPIAQKMPYDTPALEAYSYIYDGASDLIFTWHFCSAPDDVVLTSCTTYGDDRFISGQGHCARGNEGGVSDNTHPEARREFILWEWTSWGASGSTGMVQQPCTGKTHQNSNLLPHLVRCTLTLVQLQWAVP